jgi:anaerobic magnesium-protoporphyrin IX monomethyl ester cyclase
MPDLLLTHGYFMHEDAKELSIRKPYTPLGLLYICSHLRAKGFAVEVFDSTFSSRSDLFRRLRTERPSVLGVYANLMTRGNVVEILRVAREAGWKTLVGGPEPGAYVEEYLAAGADVVVIGEGEATAEELLPALQAAPPAGASGFESLSKIQGIAFLNCDGRVERTEARPQIAKIDALPWPARDAVDIESYLRTWRDAHGQSSLSLITARGCPYHCRWCSHQVFGKTHRRRNPRMVVDEVEFLLETYQPDMLWIADDVFTIHHGWLREYSAEMRRRDLHIPFECISRADRLNPQAVRLLAELGCLRVWIGSESGSQRILDAMERGVSVDEVQSAVALCKANGIQTGMFLMWGYEGEDLGDIEATIEHVKRSDPDIFFTTVAYPIKGTPYYDSVSSRRALVQVKGWAETSDREIRIRGRHSRAFYGHADQLLRDEVELARKTRAGNDARAETALQERIRASRAALISSASEIEA